MAPDNIINAPVQVDDQSLPELLRTAQVPVLVDYYADWCGPCRFMAPILERFAREHAGEVIVAKLDTDRSPAETIRMGIRGIPTLILFSDGREVDRQVGAVPGEYLANMLATVDQ